VFPVGLRATSQGHRRLLGPSVAEASCVGLPAEHQVVGLGKGHRYRRHAGRPGLTTNTAAGTTEVLLAVPARDDGHRPAVRALCPHLHLDAGEALRHVAAAEGRRVGIGCVVGTDGRPTAARRGACFTRGQRGEQEGEHSDEERGDCAHDTPFMLLWSNSFRLSLNHY